MGLTFEVVPSDADESAITAKSPARLTRLLSRLKAESVDGSGATVIGADTVVALGERVFGKPSSKQEAYGMLRALSGKTHSVFTGVCLIGEGFFAAETAETKVEFYPLSEELIGRYVESGLPMDKAGAYGIQDGYPLVKSYDGSYENVVGLPLEEVRALLNRAYGGDTYVKTCD